MDPLTNLVWYKGKKQDGTRAVLHEGRFSTDYSICMGLINAEDLVRGINHLEGTVKS